MKKEMCAHALTLAGTSAFAWQKVKQKHPMNCTCNPCLISDGTLCVGLLLEVLIRK